MAIFHDRFDELKKELRDLSINPVSFLTIAKKSNQFVNLNLIFLR